ncbi:interferon stimulated protein 15b [Lates japonicus]
MDVIITMLSGTSHTLRVHSQATVGDLKKIIHEKLGVPPQRQKLVFVNGQRTDLSNDSQPITYYGVQSGSRVSLLVTEPQVVQVLLKNDKGNINTYDIKPDEAVSNFKRRVQSREGVPTDQFYLTYEGKQLMDGRELSYYNIGEMSTINMSLRLRGG